MVKTLYAMNLNERTLIAIDTETKTVLNQYSIPNPGCTNSDNTIEAVYHFTNTSGTIEGKGHIWQSGTSRLSGVAGNVSGSSLADFNPTDAPQNLFANPVFGNNLSLPLAIGNGTYEVSLYFRDYGNGIGARVFDISLEGLVVADDFDIEADNTTKWDYLNLNTSGGDNGNYSHFGRVGNEQTFTVTVTDGTLNINLDRVSGFSPLLSAVKVKNTAISPSSANDYRPWGIGIEKGKIYVGLVCSAETSGMADDLTASVFELQSNSFTEVLSFPLDYDRSFGSRGPNNPELSAAWNAWSDDASYATWDGNFGLTFANLSHSQPILSDIDFDSEGNMILGFLDRGSHQVGYANYTPTNGSTALEFAFSAGDVLKACRNGGQWLIEGNPSCPQNYTGISGHIGHQGINGGEYFGEDHATVGTAGDVHDETHWGGIVFLKNTNQLVNTAMDPRFNLNAGGLTWYDNDTGGYVQGYEVYGNTNANGTEPQFFGKANGLGDVELLCEPAPLEIGNYVWCDSIQNGIQDACERGIDSILVQLYDRNGILVGQDSTSNSGQYYFNQNNVDTTGITVDGSGIASPATAWSGMSYSTQYFIVFGDGQFATDEFTVGGEMYGITSVANTGTNDNIDSDVDGSSLTTGSLGTRPDGLPFIDMTTNAVGCGDHQYDLGLSCQQAYDYGDLPDIADGITGINDYETYDSTGGPSHLIIPGLYLGDTVDVDTDGIPHFEAFGDDLDGADDEDGITISPSLNVVPNRVIRIPLSVTNTTTDTAYLEAWIDWNGNGNLEDAGEMVVDLKDNTDGIFPTYLEITVPATAITGSSVGFRLRLSNTDNMTPYGRINSGEVEDYLISIDCPQVICLPVITNVIRKE